MLQMADGGVMNLIDKITDGTEDGLLGIWSTQSAVVDEVAFEAASPQRANTLAWRVGLPPDMRRAAMNLSAAEADLTASQDSLSGASERLTAFAKASAGRQTGAVGTPVNTSMRNQPESVLADIVYMEQAHDTVALAVDKESIAFRQPWRTFNAGLERLMRSLTNLAVVETHVGVTRVGWTVVGWSGSIHTVWSKGVSRENAALHQRALALACATRVTLVRMVALAVRGAALLSTALATPVGPLLALPAVWTFILAVQAEARRLKSLS